MDDRIITLLRDVAFDLQHPDPCWSPISEIADHGDRAVPSLIEALGHDDPIIRRTAAHALGQLRPPVDNSLDLGPAIPHLEKMLATDTDCLARLHAAEAVWSITNTKNVVPVFVKALNHESVEVRHFAVTMLGGIHADLGEILQPLIAALADSDPSVCVTAAQVLAQYGDAASEAIPHLERLLLEDDHTRIVAVHAILRIDPLRVEALTPVLADALRSNDPKIRQTGAQVLGEIPTAGAMAVHSLIDALGDDEDVVRILVLKALENLGSTAAPAIPTLVSVLMNDDDMVPRGMAAGVLGAIGPTAFEAVPELITCLHEPGDDPLTTYFRLQVARALWRITG